MRPSWGTEVLVVATLAAAVAACGWFYEAGQTKAEARCLARDNAALVAANAKIVELQNAAREKERLAALDQAALVAKYEQENARAKTDSDRLIADLRAGNVRLRVALAAAGSAGGSAVCPTAPGAAERDAAPTAELPGPVAADLVQLADDADAVVRQLGEAQDVVRLYQKVCGASG